jgi:hypothetical protein
MLPVFRLSLIVAIGAAAIPELTAQQMPQKPAIGLCRPNALLNPFVAPVSGEPVTVTYVIKTERLRPDGDIETQGHSFQVARDSKGRISHELGARPPASSVAPMVGMVLYDPRTQMSQTIDPANRTDVQVQIQLHPPGRLLETAAVSASGNPKIENLGTKTISGLSVMGVRETWRGPVQPYSGGQPSQTSFERWYSNDLHMIVFERRITPLGIVVMTAVSQIDRREPDSALFKVPQGYRVIRPKRQVLTRFAAATWAIRPPDYDPNDLNGNVAYPSMIGGPWE